MNEITKPFPTMHFLIMSGVWIAVLWHFWLVPCTMFVNTHAVRGGILSDIGTAAIFLMVGGVGASISTLPMTEWLVVKLKSHWQT